MDDGRLNRSPMDGLINQLRVPAQGRDGAEDGSSKANAEVSPESNRGQEAGRESKGSQPTEGDKKAGSSGGTQNPTSQHVSSDVDALKNSALPSSDLRANVPNAAGRNPEEIPVPNLKGLIEIEQKASTSQSENVKAKKEAELSNEKVLRDAHTEKIEKTSPKVESERIDTKDNQPKSRSEADSGKQSERLEKSIHLSDKREERINPPALQSSSEKSEPKSVFRSAEPQPSRLETKPEAKTESRVEIKAAASSVSTTPQEKRDPLPKQEPDSRERPLKAEVKGEAQKEAPRVESGVKEKTLEPQQKVQEKSQVERREVIPERREKEREPIKTTEERKDPEAQVKEVRAEKVVEQVKEQRVESPKREQVTVEERRIEPERRPEPEKRAEPNIEKRTEVRLEERVEKIIVPEPEREPIKVPPREDVIIRRAEIVEHEKISVEAVKDKEVTIPLKDGEQVIEAREVRHVQVENIQVSERFIEESRGIVVEKEGPHSSSSGDSTERGEPIELKQLSVEKIIEKIDEVTPTVSVAEGSMLSEVRGVIAEIIRVNEASLISGREMLPEEISKLEALSDQLRSTISQAVDELSRKMDKSYEEIVLLNELRVLLSELSRDPLLQLGTQIDDTSLFEAKSQQDSAPKNMLEEAYEKVKEVVSNLLGFGEGEKAPLKEEMPPPIIIFRDKINTEEVEGEEEIQVEEEQELESKASRSVHAISGEVLDSVTKRGISGVAIYGGILGVAVTDNEGQFTFENVQHGVTFMIGPDKKGYKFTPSFVSGTATTSERFTFIAMKR